MKQYRNLFGDAIRGFPREELDFPKFFDPLIFPSKNYLGALKSKTTWDVCAGMVLTT